ncbi:MAG: hypothetical protein L3J68_01405 [Thermoplasmata archaeon]|nr:hypothetical protein [Thermoplasmata archaeon]
MRAGLVVVGIVLAIIGAALLFVPVLPQSNETATSSSSTPYYAGSVSGFSLTGSIVVAVSWSTGGNTSVNVIAATCGGSCDNASDVSGITSQNGTSGSFTLSQPNGGSIVMGVIYSGETPVTVTFKITTTLSTVGTLLIVLGIILLILGVVLGRKSKAATPPTPQPVNPAMGPGGAPPPT